MPLTATGTTVIEVADGPLLCDGCLDPIVDGMHYMGVAVELHTAGENAFTIVDEGATMPTILTATVHHPGCFMLWAQRDPILVDVFADTGRH